MAATGAGRFELRWVECVFLSGAFGCALSSELGGGGGGFYADVVGPHSECRRKRGGSVWLCSAWIHRVCGDPWGVHWPVSGGLSRQVSLESQ